MMMIVDKDKFREEISEYVDKYGQIETTITKLNIALERSSKPLVRCRECKHRPVKHPDKKGIIWITAPRIDNEDCLSAFVPTVGEFDLTCPYLCDDPYYNRMPDDDWYCSRGER